VPRFFAVLVLMFGCWMLAAPARASNTCDGARTLANAARAYRQLRALFDTARYTIQVPGAPQHLETTEFGFDNRRTAFLRMPGLYVMAVQGNRLVLAVDPASTAERVLDRAAGADLQATVDAAFDGHGAPLVPVPLLLRAARGTDDEVQAFRSRLLHRLNVSACRQVADARSQPLVEVSLEADNGIIQARFDPDSAFLLGYHGEISTAPGNAPIVADVSFEPHPGALLPDFMADGARSVERVQHLSELVGAQTDGPAEPLHQIGLQSLDGRLFALDRLAGDITILEFWARWCAPCRLTLPTVARLAAWAKAENLPVHVVLVNTAEGFESAAAARSESASTSSSERPDSDRIIESKPEPNRRPTSALMRLPWMTVGRMVAMLSSKVRWRDATSAARVSAAPTLIAASGWRMHRAVSRRVPKLWR